MVPLGKRRVTDALLDHISELRGERLIAQWALSYLEILADEMLTSCEGDRTAMIHEMLFVIRGTE